MKVLDFIAGSRKDPHEYTCKLLAESFSELNQFMKQKEIDGDDIINVYEDKDCNLLVAIYKKEIGE